MKYPKNAETSFQCIFKLDLCKIISAKCNQTVFSKEAFYQINSDSLSNNYEESKL